jgi:molecular chaperone HscA
MIDFSRNHFELFGLPQRYDVDAGALDRRYRALQSEVHPDRYATAAESERRLALQSSARVNEAYRALKDPVGRAEYLLALHGVDALAETDTALAMDFLERQLERREAASDAQAGGDSAALAALLAQVRAEYASAEPRLAALLDADGAWEGRAHACARAQVPRQACRRPRRDAIRHRFLMALLQISEPGESPEPHQRRLAVGIDLGTTNSLVATVRSGIPVVLPDESGHPLLPSIVHYGERGVLVRSSGRSAASRRPAKHHCVREAVHGSRIVRSRRRAAVSVSIHRCPGHGDAHNTRGSQEPRRNLRGGPSHTGVYALRRVSAGRLAGAVVTVPAYFDDAQRQATKDAARLAGLNVLRLLNEPTAAAIAYGLDHAAEGTYASTISGAVRSISPSSSLRAACSKCSPPTATPRSGATISIIAVLLGDRGGAARAVVARDTRLLMVKARESEGEPDAAPLGDDRRGAFLRREGGADADDRNLLGDHADAGGEDARAVRRALRDAALAPADIDGVVMVGGATRMPQIQKAVGELFGAPPLTNLNPDQAVALGAAIQANVLAGNRAAGDDWLLLDVIPLSLGLETMGGLVEKIVPRNSTIPVSRAQEFTTYKDGQTAMAIHVVQGEREKVSDCRSLARFELRGIPPMVAGAARIRVTFQVDADGLLSVAARELTSGIESAITVKPSYGLSDTEIARMLQESFEHAMEDMTARALAEAQVEADQLVAATHTALAADPDLLNADERAAIESALAAVARCRAQADQRAIAAATAALNHATAEFAARRMDRSVGRALTGRSIDALT